MSDPENILNNAQTGGAAGDDVALAATNHPLLITDEMVQAGLDAIKSSGHWTDRDTLRKIYIAMVTAAPAEPTELNEASLETVEIEVPRGPEWDDPKLVKAATAVAREHGREEPNEIDMIYAVIVFETLGMMRL